MKNVREIPSVLKELDLVHLAQMGEKQTNRIPNAVGHHIVDKV